MAMPLSQHPSMLADSVVSQRHPRLEPGEDHWGKGGHSKRLMQATNTVQGLRPLFYIDTTLLHTKFHYAFHVCCLASFQETALD